MMHGKKYRSGGASLPCEFPYFAGPGALRDLQRLEQQTYAAGDSSVGGTPEEQIRLTELSNMWHEEDHSATSPFGAVTACAVLSLYRLPGAAVGFGQGGRPRCPDAARRTATTHSTQHCDTWSWHARCVCWLVMAASGAASTDHDGTPASGPARAAPVCAGCT